MVIYKQNSSKFISRWFNYKHWRCAAPKTWRCTLSPSCAVILRSSRRKPRSVALTKSPKSQSSWCRLMISILWKHISHQSIWFIRNRMDKETISLKHVPKHLPHPKQLVVYRLVKPASKSVMNTKRPIRGSPAQSKGHPEREKHETI